MLKIYEITQENLPIVIDVKEVILTSELNLSYLQGVRDSLGIRSILIGSNGKEIQFFDEAPYYTDFNSVGEAVEAINK